MAADRREIARGGPAARSVRARTTVGAVLVVGVALVAASVALVVLLRRTLQDNVQAAARLRAGVVVGFLEEGMSPDALRIADEEDVVVQVVDETGNVVASSPRLADEPAMARIHAGGSRIVAGLPGEDADPFLFVAEAADTPAGSYSILVGRNLDTVEESASAVTTILLVSMPILLLVVGGTTWAVVGRALSPVEAIRREVSEISGPELNRRVPIPPGDDEIARLARTMNAMLARIEESHGRQRRLVSDASHELRSPIAGIRHHAEVALSHPDAITVNDLAAEVLAEDLRLERLAEDLLLLAQADEHTLQMTARPLDLDDLVIEEARRLRQITPLRIDATEVSAARVRGDRRKLQRVVGNLAENAARHASSAIRLAVREDDGEVVLEVDDDGPGISPEERRVVFERFTRLDDARDRGHGGAGLGLAIVAEVVAAHGGTVSVGEAPLGGARFTVTLPRSPSEAVRPTAFRQGSGPAS